MQKNQTASPNEAVTARKKLLGDIYDFLELFAIAAAIILLVFCFLTRLSIVEGGSMQHTLEGNDKLLISGLFYTPSESDIVVIQSPKINDGKAIVKRVIATAGQTVYIDEQGTVSVYNPDGSGGVLNEEDGSLGYTVHYSSSASRPRNPYGAMQVTVPEGKVFVLGDHRNNSHDSRAFGCVDVCSILGKVYMRILPLSSLRGF